MFPWFCYGKKTKSFFSISFYYDSFFCCFLHLQGLRKITFLRLRLGFRSFSGLLAVWISCWWIFFFLEFLPEIVGIVSSSENYSNSTVLLPLAQYTIFHYIFKSFECYFVQRKICFNADLQPSSASYFQPSLKKLRSSLMTRD